MNKNILITGVITALLIVGGVFWFTQGAGTKVSVELSRSEPVEGEVPLETTAKPLITPEEAKEESDSAKLTKVYTSNKYPFSFKYPEGFSATVFPYDEGNDADTIMINGLNKKTSIQIYISTFDEVDTSMTSERIHEELPDMPVNNPQEVILGSSGKGVAFESGDGGLKTQKSGLCTRRSCIR